MPAMSPSVWSEFTAPLVPTRRWFYSQLFNKILTCPNHILLTLLPPTNAQNYSIRNRPHNRQLLDHISRITDCNFTVSMLYRNMYWLLYILDMRFVTARCYASAVLAMGLCLCLSVCVCLCLCLSQVGVVLKRLNIGSHKQHHTIPPGTLVFWSQRSPRNSTGITPYEGAKCRWGGSKSATFDK